MQGCVVVCNRTKFLLNEVVRRLNTLIKSEKANPGACDEEKIMGKECVGRIKIVRNQNNKALKETA